MDTTTHNTTRTVVRNPQHIIISGFSITASDAYGDENRETIEIIGKPDQIVSNLVDWVDIRHRDAQAGSEHAKQDLERLAGSMGLAYVVKTAEA